MGKTVWCIMIIFWMLGGFGHKGVNGGQGCSPGIGSRSIGSMKGGGVTPGV